jgi:hypothetical protein
MKLSYDGALPKCKNLLFAMLYLFQFLLVPDVKRVPFLLAPDNKRFQISAGTRAEEVCAS